MPKTIKLVLVGDGALGKTCLISVYIDGTFPQEYAPDETASDVSKVVVVDDIEYTVEVWDTSGREEEYNGRIPSYPHTDVFLVCFSVADRTSFDNAENKWISEFMVCEEFPKDAKWMLVGCKTDLRTAGDGVVTSKEGAERAQKIGAFDYKECSAWKRTGVNEVFQTAIDYAIKEKKRRRCNVQ
jgi:small GTP-binding protein